jgi:hypothetical protein
MCPLVLGLMYITAPITWPIAKGLDLWMGEHKAQRFSNMELSELIKLHSITAIKSIGVHHVPEGVQGLDQNAINVMTNVMTSS